MSPRLGKTANHLTRRAVVRESTQRLTARLTRRTVLERLWAHRVVRHSLVRVAQSHPVMPTIISHSIVALSLAPCFGGKRVPRSLAALGAFCAIAPDFDVIGLRLGIPYGSMFGHRGFSHSLVRSEEHTSELQSLMRISYAVFCLKKKKRKCKINFDHITHKHN